MRTIRTKIYKFSELSKQAKQNAIDWWRNGETFDYLYQEANDSLEKFAEVFGIKIDQYDFQEHYRSEYRFDIEDNILELTGQRLATYIWNNYRNSIYKGKYYGKLVKTFKDGSQIPVSKEYPNGTRHVKRYSKCQISSCCPFTGVCYDDDLLYPILQFMEKPNNKTDFKDLLEDCFLSLNKSVNGEVEARMEDDAVAETIEANEYEFTKDGNIF